MAMFQKKSRYKTSGQVFLIPTEDIQPNPAQPRRDFSYEKLLELAQSIAENGMIHPLTIMFTADKTVLISGERRLRAAKIAGIREVPCVEMAVDITQASLLALIENLQRVDINCFEEAEGIQQLMVAHGFTQEEAANKLGCAQSTVANRLRLLRLSSEERQAILKAGLTERHARALIRIEDAETREATLIRIIKEKLNVAQTDRLVDEILQGKIRRKRPLPLIRDVRLFINTVNNAVDTMRRSGIEAQAEKTETEDYIEYVVRIPKGTAYNSETTHHSSAKREITA